MAVIKYLDPSLEPLQSTMLRGRIARRIVAQNNAINGFINVMDKYHGGLFDQTRPIGSLLLLGPTGVGKTELVEAASEAAHFDKLKLIKIDCGEFQMEHEITKLVGSPPGYLGHRETPPRLNAKMLQEGHSTHYPLTFVLFDEIEKASDALWRILLGVLDRATLTMGDNTKVDFHNSILFFTSNVGSAEMQYAIGNRLGFGAGEAEERDYAELEKIAIEAAKRKFPAEFINRLDQMVYCHTLTREQVAQVMDKQLERVQIEILTGGQNFYFKLGDGVKDLIMEQGYDPKYNGRQIRRAVERLVSNPLSKIIATKQVVTGQEVLIERDGNELKFGLLGKVEWL